MSPPTPPASRPRSPFLEIAEERRNTKRRRLESDGLEALAPEDEGWTGPLVLGDEGAPVFSRASSARRYARDPFMAPTALANELHRATDVSGFYAQESADVTSRVGQTQSKAARIIRLLRRTGPTELETPASRPRFIQHGSHACAECRGGDWVCVAETRVRCLSCGHKPCSGTQELGPFPVVVAVDDVQLPMPAGTASCEGAMDSPQPATALQRDADSDATSSDLTDLSDSEDDGGATAAPNSGNDGDEEEVYQLGDTPPASFGDVQNHYYSSSDSSENGNIDDLHADCEIPSPSRGAERDGQQLLKILVGKHAKDQQTQTEHLAMAPLDMITAYVTFGHTVKLLGDMLLADEKTLKFGVYLDGLQEAGQPTPHNTNGIVQAFRLLRLIKSTHFAARNERLQKASGTLWADFQAIMDLFQRQGRHILKLDKEVSQLKRDKATLEEKQESMTERFEMAAENSLPKPSTPSPSLPSPSHPRTRLKAKAKSRKFPSALQRRLKARLIRHQSLTTSAAKEVKRLKAQVSALTAEKDVISEKNTALAEENAALKQQNKGLTGENADFEATKKRLLRVIAEDSEDPEDVLDAILEGATKTHITNHRLGEDNADLVHRLHKLSKVDLPAALRENERLETALSVAQMNPANQAKGQNGDGVAEAGRRARESYRTGLVLSNMCTKDDNAGANAENTDVSAENAPTTTDRTLASSSRDDCAQLERQLETLHRRILLLETAPLLDDTVRVLKQENHELWLKVFAREQYVVDARVRGAEIADAIIADIAGEAAAKRKKR